jgi:hypothetical protein
VRENPRPYSPTCLEGQIGLLRGYYRDLNCTLRECGKRGGFFLVDVDNPEELFTLFGPELYDTSRVEAHPVMSMEAAGQMFGQWAEESR